MSIWYKQDAFACDVFFFVVGEVGVVVFYTFLRGKHLYFNECFNFEVTLFLFIVSY